MNISFIGAGNLAWHLAPAFENAGHPVSEIYSRKQANARELIGILYDARPQLDLNFANSPSELFILAVPDDSLAEVCSQLVLPENAMLVHTSGAKSLTALRQWMNMYSDVPVQTGVFYPLQTFSRGLTPLDFKGIPLCIEASDAVTEDALVALGQDLSSIVYLVNTVERRMLHMAAVFACNFTNHLLAIATDLTDIYDLEFDLLKPIIKETFRKALAADHPANVQTGPARRGDLATMSAHLELLHDQPNLAEIYEILSDSIGRRYRK